MATLREEWIGTGYDYLELREQASNALVGTVRRVPGERRWESIPGWVLGTGTLGYRGFETGQAARDMLREQYEALTGILVTGEVAR